MEQVLLVLCATIANAVGSLSSLLGIHINLKAKNALDASSYVRGPALDNLQNVLTQMAKVIEDLQTRVLVHEAVLVINAIILVVAVLYHVLLRATKGLINKSPPDSCQKSQDCTTASTRKVTISKQ